jgi:hypothetical protein
LSNREELDTGMLSNEVSIDGIDSSAMKCPLAKMAAKELLVVASRDEAYLLAVGLVGHS